MKELRIENRSSILNTIKEFNELGRDGFLAKYGYGKARQYYLRIDGKYYDSKAIAGVAYGIEHPREGPLQPNDFSGGERTVKRWLQNLGFTVVKGRLESKAAGLVLVENEVTYSGEFDFWADDTGVQYHFPNQYRNRIQKGLTFIYYRGVRRRDGKRGQAEYFGTGRIGDIWRDPQQPKDTPARQRRWYCVIDDYIPFDVPVPAKKDGQPYERITQPLGWRTGVREVDSQTLEAILTAAGISQQPKLSLPIAPLTLVPEEADPAEMVVQREKSSSATSVSPGTHRSTHAKQIGDWAEELIYGWLCSTLPDSVRDSVDWVAQRGETPGWDICYTNENSDVIAIEVKATTLTRFTSIEITANEWAAAKDKGANYAIALVTGALSSQPG